MDITVGEIVRSKAGRDAGRYFVIKEIINGGYVLIVDGDLRKLERPKKKKLKHLEATGDLLQELIPGLNSASKSLLTNADIRKALKNYLDTRGIDN